VTDLLNVKDLRVDFVLDGIRFPRCAAFRSRAKGKTVALVGESGSGKSVVAQAIMGILPKIAQHHRGEILFDRSGQGTGPLIDIAQEPRNGPVMRSIRGGAISIIFQEPMTSLSPVHTIGDQIGEALQLHRKVSGRQAKELVIDMLRLVGFPDPGRGFKTYPFELVGRPAPARDDRDGVDLPSDAADRR
jgi:peptide/nickel transport system ATP-binding protein